MRKKIFAAILATVMVACLLPTAAFAARESGIQLGTGGLNANDEIYLGNYTDGTTYDVPWIVLASGKLSHSSVATGANVLSLLSTWIFIAWIAS